MKRDSYGVSTEYTPGLWANRSANRPHAGNQAGKRSSEFATKHEIARAPVGGSGAVLAGNRWKGPNSNYSRHDRIGGIRGGVDALTATVAALPDRFPAAVFAVLHGGAHPSILPQLLRRAGRLPAHHARDIGAAPVQNRPIAVSRGPNFH